MQSYKVLKDYRLKNIAPDTFLVVSIIFSFNSVASVLMLFLESKSTDKHRSLVIQLCLYMYHVVEVALRTACLAFLAFEFQEYTPVLVVCSLLLRLLIWHLSKDTAPVGLALGAEW